jgi:hypothetical protein
MHIWRILRRSDRKDVALNHADSRIGFNSQSSVLCNRARRALLRPTARNRIAHTRYFRAISPRGGVPGEIRLAAVATANFHVRFVIAYTKVIFDSRLWRSRVVHNLRDESRSDFAGEISILCDNNGILITTHAFIRSNRHRIIDTMSSLRTRFSLIRNKQDLVWENFRI